jgi:hypothetical protein
VSRSSPLLLALGSIGQLRLTFARSPSCSLASPSFGFGVALASVSVGEGLSGAHFALAGARCASGVGRSRAIASTAVRRAPCGAPGSACRRCARYFILTAGISKPNRWPRVPSCSPWGRVLITSSTTNWSLGCGADVFRVTQPHPKLVASFPLAGRCLEIRSEGAYWLGLRSPY